MSALHAKLLRACALNMARESSEDWLQKS